MKDEKPSVNNANNHDKVKNVNIPNDNNLKESQEKNINPKTGQNINKMNNNPSERRL